MSIFSCCEREDETKYSHPCGCPSATFSCESESISPTLCGWTEVNKNGYVPSEPPLRYRKMSVNGSGQRFIENECDGTSYRSFIEVLSGTASCELGSLDCVNVADGQNVNRTYTLTYCVDGSPGDSETETNPIYTSERACTEGSSNWYFGLSMIPTSSVSAYIASSGQNDTKVMTRTISVEDTESDAIARETPVSGTSCNSVWQTRSTGFSWVKRTSGYTIECEDLIAGLEYEVKPVIRKRTAVIGSFGEWEDVTVTPVTFTATGTTETIDQSGEPIPLDHIQGYEYEITAVSIEKTA